MTKRRPSRPRGAPYPAQVCIACAREFVPRREDGSSLPKRCPECLAAWRAAARGTRR